MRILQDAMDEVLGELPQLAVKALVEKKLKDQGVTVSTQLNPTVDHNVAMIIMGMLVDEIGESLLDAHERLAQDEEFYAASRKRGPPADHARRR